MIYIIGTIKPAIYRKEWKLKKLFPGEKFGILGYKKGMSSKQILDKGCEKVIISDITNFDDIYALVKECGQKVSLVYPYSYNGKNELIEVEHWKPELDYYEYHISWHCNLNCKGCAHYSNLIMEPKFANYDIYKKDLERLHELLGNVKSIRLMGGEPFLNPELPKFIELTRYVFPISDLRIVSNGLLIPTCDDNILKVMRDNDVRLDISQYPPTSKILDKIEAKVKPFNIPIYLGEYVDTFHANSDGRRENDMVAEWKACDARTCHFLSEGQIAACAAPIVTTLMKDSIEFHGKVVEEDIVDLYDSKLTGEELVRRVNSPIPFCKYCDKQHCERFPWKGGYREYYNGSNPIKEEE